MNKKALCAFFEFFGWFLARLWPRQFPISIQSLRNRL